jgi:histone H3/H4
MSENLVVVSKVKKYIKAKAGMNTSSSVMDQLSKIVEKEISKAVENAKSDNRKTVMDRDFHMN